VVAGHVPYREVLDHDRLVLADEPGGQPGQVVAVRRPGDPARIVASGELAARDLGWRMRHDIDAMVASAWQAWQASQDLGPQ
jgi:UDP-glucose 4-epimerase